MDDKINARAAERGISIRELTRRDRRASMTKMSRRWAACRRRMTPRATEHIAEMIAMIEQLIAAGHAYAAEGHVLFDVSSKADYGKLARRSLDEMIAGARVEVAPYKKNADGFRAVEAVGRRDCRAGIRPGAAAVRAGTSNARRWRANIWARPSTFMAAAST